MIRTTTTNQYAALAKPSDGSWIKLHPFTLKSKEAAERAIQEHKKLNPRNPEIRYKVVVRTVTITTEEWRDLEEVTMWTT